VEPTVVQSRYVPREQMYAFHGRTERFSVLVLHRRFGKTVACVNDLIERALQNKRAFPQPMYGYIAPYYAQAKHVAWQYLKWYTEGIAEKVMESELSVVLLNGAKIRLFGADNPDSIRGGYFDGCVIDEYGDIAPRMFDEVVLPMLADYKGWCVFIGTPKGRNHFADRWEAAKDNSNWFSIRLTAYETGVIDDEELRLIRETSDESTFAQEMLCSFEAANKGSYYGKLLNDLEQDGHFGSHPYDTDRDVFTAWDIGYSDDTSVWFYQSDGKHIRVIDFMSVSGYSVDDVLSALRDKPYAYGVMHLPHDAKNKSFQTGKSVRELMMAAGCKTQIVPSLSIQDGIQAVRATLPKVFFNTACERVKEGVAALRSYQREWDDRRKMFRDTPKHDWSSNPADAFRMLSLACNPKKMDSGQIRRYVSGDSDTNNVITLESLYNARANTRSNARI
jgi:phage terminase large subunit